MATLLQMLKNVSLSRSKVPGNTIGGDAAELQRQELDSLDKATTAGKIYQKDIVKAVQGLISSGSKQLEVSRKLAHACCRYVAEGPHRTGPLSRASEVLGNCLQRLESPTDILHRALGAQVAEPLRAMAEGAPLQDAKHLYNRYAHACQDVKDQAADVAKRHLKVNEGGRTVEGLHKLQAAESKLAELMSALENVGNQTASAMTAVDAQQQQITLQRLFAMVDAERTYLHQATEIFDQLHAQMASVCQCSEATPSVSTRHDSESNTSESTFQYGVEDTSKGSFQYDEKDSESTFQYGKMNTSEGAIPKIGKNPSKRTPPSNEENHSGSAPPYRASSSLSSDESNDSDTPVPYPHVPPAQRAEPFRAKVIHKYETEGPGELSLMVGDPVLVCKVLPTGWSEVKCRGKRGWFPTSHVERLQTSKRN